MRFFESGSSSPAEKCGFRTATRLHRALLASVVATLLGPAVAGCGSGADDSFDPSGTNDAAVKDAKYPFETSGFDAAIDKSTSDTDSALTADSEAPKEAGADAAAPEPVALPTDPPLVLQLDDTGPYAGSVPCVGASVRLKSRKAASQGVVSTSYCLGDGSGLFVREPLVGDFDGDQRDDLGFVLDYDTTQCSTGLQLRVRHITAAAAFAGQTTCLPGGVSTLPKVQLAADFSGDGRADLLLLGGKKGAPWVAGSGCDGWELRLFAMQEGKPPVATHQCLGGLPDSTRVLTAKLDGDSRADLVALEPSTACGGLRAHRLLSGAAGGFADVESCLALDAGYLNDAPLVGDTDGDGREEVLLQARTSIPSIQCAGVSIQRLALDSQGHFTASAFCLPIGSGDTLPQPAVKGDFDGDARADVALVYYNTPEGVKAQILAGLANGSLDVHSATFGDGSKVLDHPVQVLDVNGDGRDDFLLAFASPSNATCATARLRFKIAGSDWKFAGEEHCLAEDEELLDKGIAVGRFSGQTRGEMVFSGVGWRTAAVAKDGFTALNAAVASAWNDSKQEFQNKITLTSGWNPQTLYSLQTYMTSLVRYVQMNPEQSNNPTWLEELATLAQSSFQTLSVGADGVPEWRCQLPPEEYADAHPKVLCQHWDYGATHPYQNNEVFLCSAQWIFQVTNILEAITSLPEQKRTAVLEAYAEAAIPVVRSHLFRWLESDSPLVPGPHPYATRLSELLKTPVLTKPMVIPPGQDSVLPEPHFADKDMFMIGIAADLLAVHRNRPDWKVLSAAEVTTLSDFLETGRAIIKARLKPSVNGTAAGTLVLDPFEWDRYEDHKYAGYIEAPKPTSATAIYQASGTSMDVSHLRRIVQILFAIDRVAVGSSQLDTVALAKGFSQQIVSNVLIDDASGPKFKNYFGGVDGWYRVGYFNGYSTIPGYPPSTNGKSIVNGGYGFFAFYLSEWAAKLSAVYEFSQKTDSASVNHRNMYLWDSADAKTVLQTLPGFLPVVARPRR